MKGVGWMDAGTIKEIMEGGKYLNKIRVEKLVA